MHVTAPPEHFIVFGCEVRKVRVQMACVSERSALCRVQVTFIGSDRVAHRGGLFASACF